MSKLQTLKPRVGSLPGRVKTRTETGSNWGKGRGGHKWRTLREKIFQRDGFKCRQCYENGILKAVDLHNKEKTRVGYCDHYVAEAGGGETLAENLWILCFECHETKSSQDNQQQFREPRNLGSVDHGLVLC